MACQGVRRGKSAALHFRKIPCEWPLSPPCSTERKRLVIRMRRFGAGLPDWRIALRYTRVMRRFSKGIASSFALRARGSYLINDAHLILPQDCRKPLRTCATRIPLGRGRASEETAERDQPLTRKGPPRFLLRWRGGLSSFSGSTLPVAPDRLIATRNPVGPSRCDGRSNNAAA